MACFAFTTAFIAAGLTVAFGFKVPKTFLGALATGFAATEDAIGAFLTAAAAPFVAVFAPTS